jgi:phosphatidylinositol glycan class F
MEAPKPFESVPISVLNTPGSNLYSLLHPVLLLSTFYLSFDGIVSDPVLALPTLLLPTLALQSVWCVLCLPLYAGPTSAAAAKDASSSVKAGSQAAQKKLKTKRREDVPLPSRISSLLLSILLAVVAGTPVLLAALVLFGAPITTHIPHTSLLALHVSLLVVLPLVYTRGLEKRNWELITAAWLPLDGVFGAAIGTLLGCWLSAIVIPLDWDRDWQKWPVPLVTGAYGGYIAGLVLCQLPGLKGRLIGLGGPDRPDTNVKAIEKKKA